MKLSHILLLVLVAAVWGFNFVPVRIGLNEVPPLTFTALRFLVTSLPIIFFIKKPKIAYRNLAAYGILLYGGQFSFLFSAIHTGLTAGLASLILQLQAFFTIGLALIIFRETPTRAQIAGAVVSSLGIVVVGMHVGGGDVTLPGLVLAIIAALCWSGGNLITKSFGKVDMFAVVVWGNMFAGIVLAALAAVIEGPEVMVRSVADIHMPTALSLAYIAYISTFVGYTLWSRMLSHHPAAVVAPFTLLVPPFAMVSASLLLGEAYPLWKFEATALILCGLAINQFGGKLRARILKMLVRNPV